MLISSLNSDMLLPPFEEYLKAEHQKKVEEKERCEELRLKGDEIISKMLFNKDLAEIQTYREAILNYLIINGSLDLIYNTSKLESFIKIYYKILSKKSVSITEYITLQKLSRTSKNEVTAEIQRKYEESKNILTLIAIKKYQSQGITDYDTDLINNKIYELIEDYKKGYLDKIELKYSSLAITTILYIQSHTNLHLSPSLKSERLTLRR